MFVGISVEESMSTYFGLFAIILLASFWNEYNEKKFLFITRKKSIHLYSYMESFEKISETRLGCKIRIL